MWFIQGKDLAKGCPLTAGVSVILILEAISKTVDHVQGQGASRGKSAAYTVVCEHF